MKNFFCVFCLKGVEEGRQERQPHNSLSTSSPHPPSTQDVGSLCKLLTPQPELESLGLITEQDGNSCSLCSTCRELIQEMGQIREQISQLQNQIGKRIGLLRKLILQSDVKRLDKLVHCEVDEVEKLREIREILSRLAAQDDNFVTTEVEVKLEPEDVDYFEDDPLSLQGPSSPSSFLLHPEHEDALIIKEEEGSDNSFSINPQPHNRRKLNLRSAAIIMTENVKNLKTKLPKKKRLSSSEPKIKPEGKISSPPSKRKRRLRKHCSPPISDSDTETSSDDDPGDDPEFDPLTSMLNDKIGKTTSSKNFPFKCIQCSKRFPTEDTLSHHVEQTHSYNCEICDKRFRNHTILRIHHAAEHANIPFAQCTICKRRFKRIHALDEHMVMRHETEHKSFFCDKCDKGFSLEMNYKRHLDLHKEEAVKPLVCEVCDTRFSNQARLDKHITTHSKPKCDICSLVCSSSTALASHRRKHTGEKPFKCDHCDEKFKDFSAKRYHTAKVHSRPDQHHLCTTCGKTFFELGTLNTHMARHEGTSMVGCDQCEEKFKDKSALESHKVDKHGADPFVCDACGATLRSAHGLATHKKIHTVEKRHKCDICDAGFRVKAVLADHMRRHTEERPFSCSECELTFKFKRNLKRHVKGIHTL